MEKKKMLQLGLAAAVLLGAGNVWFFTRGSDGEERNQYFYDLSEKKLFKLPHDAFAPVEGVGGESGDGVEAVVVCCPKCGHAGERIAFLRTHTADYKKKREAARQTGAAIEGLTRAWISENTLVRPVEGGDWRKTSSPEGEKIVGARRRCATHGEWERPLRP